MNMKDMTVTELNDYTASKSPVPGGGSISAMAGAFAAALVEATRDAFAKRIGAGLGLTEHDAEGRILVRGWVGFVEATSLAWAESPSGITRERLAELILGAFAAGVQLVKHK